MPNNPVNFSDYLKEDIRQLIELTGDDALKEIANKLATKGDQDVFLSDDDQQQLTKILAPLAGSTNPVMMALSGNINDLMNRIIQGQKSPKNTPNPTTPDTVISLYDFLETGLPEDWAGLISTLYHDHSLSIDHCKKLSHFIKTSGLAEVDCFCFFSKHSQTQILTTLLDDPFIFDETSLVNAALFVYLAFVSQTSSQALWQQDHNSLTLMDSWNIGEHTRHNAWALVTENTDLGHLLNECHKNHPELKISHLEILFLGTVPAYKVAEEKFKTLTGSQDAECIKRPGLGGCPSTQIDLTHFRVRTGPITLSHSSLTRLQQKMRDKKTPAFPFRSHGHRQGFSSTSSETLIAANNTRYFRPSILHK